MAEAFLDFQDAETDFCLKELLEQSMSGPEVSVQENRNGANFTCMHPNLPTNERDDLLTQNVDAALDVNVGSPDMTTYNLDFAMIPLFNDSMEPLFSDINPEEEQIRKLSRSQNTKKARALHARMTSKNGKALIQKLTQLHTMVLKKTNEMYTILEQLTEHFNEKRRIPLKHFIDFTVFVN